LRFCCFSPKELAGLNNRLKTAGHIPLTGYFGLSSRLNADHPAGFSKMIRCQKQKTALTARVPLEIVVPSYY
jgi:hypothetical protein